VDSVTMVVAVGVIGMQALVDCTAQRAAVTVHMVAATMMIIRATTIRTIGAVELEPPALTIRIRRQRKLAVPRVLDIRDVVVVVVPRIVINSNSISNTEQQGFGRQE
jgi:hypothetical protein